MVEGEGGFILQEFARAHRGLSAAQLAHDVASAFLILETTLMRPDGPLRTVSFEQQEITANTTLRVFPLARRKDSAYAWISVGRAHNNDVCLPDVSVSKFHAYFKDEGGNLQLHDAKSRNGTFVDGEAVAPRGEGPAVVMKSGASVRFGNAQTSFLSAHDLHKMMGHLGG